MELRLGDLASERAYSSPVKPGEHPGDHGDGEGELDPDELPPLDADEEDLLGDEADEPAEALDIDDDDADPFDDANANELNVGAMVDDDVFDEDLALSDDANSLLGDDAEPNPGLDVGAFDDDLVSGTVDAGDGEGIDGEDGEADVDTSLADEDTIVGSVDDGGAEGTNERVEDAVDVDQLPELDADDDGIVDDRALMEHLELDGDVGDVAAPPWADDPWVRRTGFGARAACSFVHAAHGRVAAGGSVLLGVEAGEQVARPLPGEQLRAHPALAIVTADGIVGSFEREVVLFDRGGQELGATLLPVAPRALAGAAGRLWALAERTLYQLDMPRAAADPTYERVIDVASDPGALVMLTRNKDNHPQVERVRGDDEAHVCISLDGDAARIASSTGARILSVDSGQAVAILGATEVVVSRNGGADFQLRQLPPLVVATFGGPSATAPLLAVVNIDAGIYLVEIPADGPTTRILDLPEDAAFDDLMPDADPSIGIDWDENRRCVWVACPLGLIAFAPSSRGSSS